MLTMLVAMVSPQNRSLLEISDVKAWEDLDRL